MKTIEKLAKEYKKASDKVYSDRKASKKVWVGHRFSKSYRGAINSKDKLTLEELSASISEATVTDRALVGQYAVGMGSAVVDGIRIVSGCEILY